ncbi:Maf family protein [Crenothrix polyspora]|uniref:dTTP/UTP pyrophosphatase n=1 Tax=Crenothrix polyspora TaxID=360316 RepID=A0A1R4HAP5_9GAMM|nr:Maf family protein [Crenothrix polyspora]SJM93293.1 putative septum formation protein [Crenothrix polyspora]
MTVQIILASASPRRKELLDQIGVSYRVVAADIDETVQPGELPLAYVQRMAAEKSAACELKCGKHLPILAADTTVVLGDVIMGKPKDKDDAFAMLRQLSGATHHVYTAISLRGNEHNQSVSMTEVSFKPLTDTELERYWHTGEPLGKAGSYAIQGLAAVFVQSIKGSFSGVVGLPLFETSQLLIKQGIQF